MTAEDQDDWPTIIVGYEIECGLCDFVLRVTFAEDQRREVKAFDTLVLHWEMMHASPEPGS